MIDPLDPTLIRLEDAARLLKPQRSVGALRRWSRSGIRGNRLSTVLVGGTQMTTPDALREFFSALSRANTHAKGRS